jgi:hypothetical protein
LAAFREAEAQREAGEFDLADATADRALLALRERYDKFSASYQSFLTCPLSIEAAPNFYSYLGIMQDWDDKLL